MYRYFFLSFIVFLSFCCLICLFARDKYIGCFFFFLFGFLALHPEGCSFAICLLFLCCLLAALFFIVVFFQKKEHFVFPLKKNNNKKDCSPAVL